MKCDVPLKKYLAFSIGLLPIGVVFIFNYFGNGPGLIVGIAIGVTISIISVSLDKKSWILSNIVSTILYIFAYGILAPSDPQKAVGFIVIPLVQLTIFGVSGMLHKFFKEVS